MLTNLFYYGHYRNLAARMDSRGQSFSSFGTPKRAWPANIMPQKSAMDNPKVLLNKADSDKVINYAKTLSSSIVGLKDAAKMFLFDMAAVERNGTTTFENHMQWIEEDLQNFISSYNKLQRVAITGHSGELARFAHYIKSYTAQNSETLSHLGIITYNNNSLSYHGMAATATKQTALNTVDIFKTAYSAAKDFLQAPLSHHMEFKGLGYYYNYTIGNYSENTFKIIDAGTLLDIAG